MERGKYSKFDEDVWRRHVEKRSRSGQSIRNYCKKSGLCISSFCRWEKIISPGKDASGFLRIETPPERPAVGGLIITTPNGYRVEAESVEAGILAARGLGTC